MDALVSSRIDYCNSLLICISEYEIRKIQSVQNAVARPICRVEKSGEISPILYRLHWLKVESRLNFKVLLFV